MTRIPKALLVLALVAVVLMAFRVSWNALRDVARTVGADHVAATLYPFVVDGLMALALVATLVLTGPDRTFALRVLAGYTLASLVLNYVHGLAPEMYGTAARTRLADWSVANWLLVLLATSLPVGAIFFGSDLVAKVLHHHPATPGTVRGHPAPGRTDVQPEHAYAADGSAPQHRTKQVQDRTEPRTERAYAQVAQRDAASRTYADPTPDEARTASTPSARPAAKRAYDEAELERKRQEAQQAYADSLDGGQPIGPAALAKQFGLSEGWGRKQIKAVEEKRAAEAGDRERPDLIGAPTH